MKQKFKEAKILLINDHDASRSIQLNILKILGFTSVDFGYEMSDGFRIFKEGNHDAILAPLEHGKNDAIGLAKLVRTDAGSPNKLVPIIAISGPQALHLMDTAREVGITDLLQAPYSVNDVSQKLKHALGTQHEQQLEPIPQPEAAPVSEALPPPPQAAKESAPEQEEAFSLTNMLLEHYMRHHEIVLMKLKFAQSATKKCIDDVRETHAKIKSHDNTSIHAFKDFDKMWETILETFIQGGISEEELFKIEKLITSVPKDIKKHYDDLSAQDKTFLTLVESLNSSAYQKAKERVEKIQKLPNPLNGKSSEDYAAMPSTMPTAEAAQGEKTSGSVMYQPRRKK